MTKDTNDTKFSLPENAVVEKTLVVVLKNGERIEEKWREVVPHETVFPRSCDD